MKKAELCAKYAVTAGLLAAVAMTAAAQQGAPAWYRAKDTEFPDSGYVSAIGSGAGEQEAKDRALSEVSLFFKTSVNFESETLSEYNRAVDSGGASRSSSSTAARERINISSREDFLGVRYTQAWYNAANRLWYVCCYINKAEAQNVYKNRISTNTTLFNAVIAQAENERELLLKLRLYKNALAIAPVIEADINALPQVGASTSEYAALAQNLKNQKSASDSLRARVTFNVQISGDRQERVQRAVSKLLESAGWKTTRGIAAYALRGWLSFEQTTTPAIPYNVIATIEFELFNADGASIFSYNKDLGRVGHRASWDGAYNAAITGIENDLEENFIREFNSSLGD